MRLMTVLGVLALSILGLSACGSKSSSSTKELPQAEFVQKADAICTQTGIKRKAAGQPPNFNPATATKAQVTGSAKYLEAEATLTKDEIAQVAGLGEPKEAAPKQAWQQLRSELQDTTIPALQKAAEDAKAGSVEGFKADFKKLEAASPNQDKLGKTVGLKVCGQG